MEADASKATESVEVGALARSVVRDVERLSMICEAHQLADAQVEPATSKSSAAARDPAFACKGRKRKRCGTRLACPPTRMVCRRWPRGFGGGSGEMRQVARGSPAKTRLPALQCLVAHDASLRRLAAERWLLDTCYPQACLARPSSAANAPSDQLLQSAVLTVRPVHGSLGKQSTCLVTAASMLHPPHPPHPPHL